MHPGKGTIWPGRMCHGDNMSEKELRITVIAIEQDIDKSGILSEFETGAVLKLRKDLT